MLYAFLLSSKVIQLYIYAFLFVIFSIMVYQAVEQSPVHYSGTLLFKTIW